MHVFVCKWAARQEVSFHADMGRPGKKSQLLGKGMVILCMKKLVIFCDQVRVCCPVIPQVCGPRVEAASSLCLPLLPRPASGAW